MTIRNRAAIDLGSNSVLLTVLSATGDVLHDEARVVGLGRGVGDGGHIQPDRIEAALSALIDYANTAARFGIQNNEVEAFATSASRRAKNSDQFYNRVKAEAGLKFTIISGAEEARLTYLGATDGLAQNTESVAVIDLGGGSTEVVQGVGPKLNSGVSLELGSTRLTEDFLGDDAVSDEDYRAMAARINELSNSLAVNRTPDIVICVAGTATTLAAIALGLTEWDSAKVHGMIMTRASLQSLIEKLKGASKLERRVIAAVAPERADSLLAGATAIDLLLGKLGVEATTISVRGLRFGVLSDSK
jgi:exopolyphosphatase/guanosine-5'-triphosphate,3'-diphosphate pyrophosphatase